MSCLFLHYGWFLQNLEKGFIRTTVHVYDFQMFAQLHIGSGQDLTFELEWINGIYANNITTTGP